jgi:hypothetical protein
MTKKLTLSAMLVALGVVFMLLGSYVQVLDLTVCALVSLLVAFACIEIGPPFNWLVWIATSVLTLLIPAESRMIGLIYFMIFGIYPILKGYIERAPRTLWYVFKLVFINSVLVALSFAFELLFKQPLVMIDNKVFVVLVYLVMNVAFIAYDMFITVMVRLYFAKFRNRIKNLLK